MSLRDFLPVSQALSRVDGEGGRLRPADPGLLPDFSRRAGGVSGGGGDAASAVAAGPAPVRNAVSERPALPGAPVGSPGPFGAPATASGKGRAGRRLPAWVEQLVLAFLRPGNRRRGTRPVQPELNFDSVRVVRNDLATSDVEVVLVRPSGRPAAMSPECRRRVLRVWWEEGTRQLRRLGHTLW